MSEFTHLHDGLNAWRLSAGAQRWLIQDAVLRHIRELLKGSPPYSAAQYAELHQAEKLVTGK